VRETDQSRRFPEYSRAKWRANRRVPQRCHDWPVFEANLAEGGVRAVA